MNAVISTNDWAWNLTVHVTFKLCYNQIYQMKTTMKQLYDISYKVRKKTMYDFFYQNVLIYVLSFMLI